MRYGNGWRSLIPPSRSRRPEGRYGEYRIKDPEGIPIILSEKGYGASGQRKVPGIRHIATSNKDPERKFQFYSRVLGMRDAGRTDDEVRKHISMSLGHAPSESQIRPRGNRPPAGFAGDGFNKLGPPALARDRTASRLQSFRLSSSKSSRTHVPNRREGFERLDQRPANRFAEYRIWDPEGNAIDLSERKGYKVNVDKEEKIED